MRFTLTFLLAFLFQSICTTSVFAQKKKARSAPAIMAKETVINDRSVWLAYLDKMARPVFSNLASNQLKEKMPVVLSLAIDNKEGRTKVAYLEAFGRTLSGIAPWLNSEGGSCAA